MWSEIARTAEMTRIGSVWLPVLLDAAIKGAVVVGLAGAATLLMRRCSAAARHLVWCLAVASLPLLPILSAVSPDWHVLPRWMAMSTDMAEKVSLAAAAEPTATREPTATQEAVLLPGDRANMAKAPIETAARQPTPPNVVEQPEADRPTAAAPPRPPDLAPNQAGPSPAVPWQTCGLLVWLVGTLLTLVPVGLGMLSLWRLRRRAELITGGPWISQLHQLAARLGVNRRMVLLRSNRRSMPMHWGILRPKLLLPVTADRWPDDRRRVVLLHELAHVKRFDCLAQLVTQLACALYWFNPLVWVALRQMHLEREAACDDLILRAGYRPPDYAQHLLQIASGLQSDLFATYSAIAMARPSRLESRLRAILDAGRNRRTLTRAAVSLIIVLLAGVVVPVAMMRAANGENDPDEHEATEEATAPTETEADGGVYDHFLYVRHNEKDGVAKTDTLVLAKVRPDRFEQRDLYTKNNLTIGWRPLCVTGGTVYGTKIGDLISIDAATGKAERICAYVRSPHYDSGRLYATVPAPDGKPVLRVFDFRRRAYRDAGPVESAFRSPPLAVSPDGKRLAYFAGRANTMSPSSFRLTLVDLETGTSKAVGPTVHSVVFMTGGGSVADGPTFAWLDSKTILLVRDEPREGPNGTTLPLVGFMGGSPSEPLLTTMNADTGKMTDLLRLPRFTRRLSEPYLRPLGKDGVPRIVVGELGQYRIDVRAKRLVEDDRIGGDYRWSRGRQPERLNFDKTELFRAGSIPEIGASPDGRRLVWLTKRGSTDAELRYHDVDAKAVRVVAEGWFPTIWSAHRRPDETIFLWTDAQDLAPAEPAEPAAGWRRFSTQPWPVPPDPREADKRRDIADFLTMTLSTDQTAYKHHEPVKLTVTLTNKTEEDVTFERPHEHSNFFGLRMKYPRGSTMIGEFERSQEVFPTDPVVIKAGESFQCTRTLEPRGLGEHNVEGAFRLQTGNWRGRAKAATIQFVVEKSPDEDRLLKVKFDRFLAQCRREFQDDPMRCDYARFFDLGPAAVPHLVAALEASDDAKFRQRMGYALAQMANAEALPYFEKLLKGEMADDREMVLDGLLNMVQRSRPMEAALRLMLVALKHPNAAVRLGAATRLSRGHDPRVAAAFEDAVRDADPKTAVTAARYLAAYEGLDLAEWLGRALEQPTRARHLAAGEIVRQLGEVWRLDYGQLPEPTPEDVAKDPARLAEYKRVLHAWQQWARENPRSSAHFFDADREHWPKKEPKPDRRDPAEHVRSLIEQLGDDEYARRQAAQQELVRIGIPATAALNGALGHEDPEIVNRVRLALAEINNRIRARRDQLRQLAGQAAKRDDRPAAAGHYRALLALPEPPLHDCREASRFFEAAEDWASYATAQEATARSMKQVIQTPVEQFIRPAPPPVDLGAREGGPRVQVQTGLDGQWRLGKGTAESWIPWVTRKQKQMVTERFDLLLGLGRLYRDKLRRPAKAAEAYAEALADVPFCTEPLKKVIARRWPVRSGELKGSWGTMAGNYLMAMHELSEMQQQTGDLDGAIETKTRKLLAQFNLAWNYRDGLVSRSARELCELLRMLTADAPLPPLFWLNVLSPEKDTVTIHLSRPEAQRDTSDIYHPNVVARPGYIFDTLQVTADMESQGRSGVLECYTVFEKTTSLARLQWDKGRKWITETFKVPPEAGLIRFEARDSQGFRVRQIRVEATFRPGPTRSGTTPVARPQPGAGEATGGPATPPAQDAASSGWGEASGGPRCKIVPSHTQIVAGQPLTFRLVVQNVGKQSVLLNNRIGTRVAFYVNDRFVSQEVSLYYGFAFRQPADGPRVITVPPGRSVEAALPVGVLTTTRLTDVANKRIIDSTANPGTYKVHALYAQRGAGGYPARWWRGTIRSPAVEIKVLPARPTKSFPATPAASPGNGRDLSRE